MEERSLWYWEIEREIGRHKDWLDPKNYKKYKLDLLLRVAVRVDAFAAVCAECHAFQSEIESLVNDLGNLVQLPKQLARQERKHYFRRINEMVKHLQKEHKLVPENYYLGIGIAIGTAMSAGIGTALGNPGVGTGIGIALGLAIGKYLDNRAEKEGRVI
jgi:hypothetical protein